MDSDARVTPASWVATVAQITESGVLLRLLTLACGIAVVACAVTLAAMLQTYWPTARDAGEAANTPPGV